MRNLRQLLRPCNQLCCHVREGGSIHCSHCLQSLAPRNKLVPRCATGGRFQPEWLGEVDGGRVGQALLTAALAGSDRRVPPAQSTSNLWLLKPSNGSGGKGISISSEVSRLGRALAEAKLSTATLVLQKYLEEPLLYDGRKFDLRVWAVVASDAGAPLGLRAYVYREGYARTSSQQYCQPDGAAAVSASGRSQLGAHLTNSSVQSHAANFGAHEEANLLSYSALDAHYGEKVGFCARVLPKIHAMVADAVLASRRELVGGLSEQVRLSSAAPPAHPSALPPAPPLIFPDLPSSAAAAWSPSWALTSCWRPTARPT